MKIFFLISFLALIIFFTRHDQQVIPLKHLNQQEAHPPVSSMVPKELIMEEKAAEITAATISLSQINAGIKKIETQLSVYSDLSYDQFSDSQLLDFNSLMQKKAVLLKTAIFRKHGQL